MQRKFNLSDTHPDPDNGLPFRLRKPFISAELLKLYHALREMVDGQYVIAVKVPLGEIVTVARPNENVQFYNRIFRKNVDFLFCDPKDLHPVLGVQLVRQSESDTIRRSESFVQDVFAAAGLPLVCVPLSEKYTMADMLPLFELAMLKVKKTEVARTADPTGDFSPICPNCGISMVLRVHRDGPKAGQQYYGCLNAPECSATIPVK